MAFDYESLRSENERRYGTDIGRIGPMLLANRYDDRTHFIYELLQNAEDALARRSSRRGPRSVKFRLKDNELRVSHFGKAFDEGDVRGICGIAQSTKSSQELTAIGRFGIGFKSVYAFSDRPEVHSGDEDFAIDNYVLPVAARKVRRDPTETVFILPLKDDDPTAHDEILTGLRGLGPRTLLFLREIEEIEWEVDGGPSGLYMRDKPVEISETARRVLLMGKEQGQPEIEETWLMFSRPVKAKSGAIAGYIELAFSVEKPKERRRYYVRPIKESPLVAFFPTILETHLGFVVQGPYRTTPSRDNIPRNDAWNQSLIRQTATLLTDALVEMQESGLLDAAAISCLPLDRAKFPDESMFAPLFNAVRTALDSKPLLPAFGDGHIPANRAKLARTQELRELIDAKQLGALFGLRAELSWLHGDITPDRTPELRQYLMTELNVSEVTPEVLFSKLTKPFLEKQSDPWIVKLYHFLAGQPALLRQGKVNDVALIRLENGTHVTAKVDGELQAFLPSASGSGFPTVRPAVCATKESKAFLVSLGLTEPDPVDDVIRNVLPRYRADEIDVGDKSYAADIKRIRSAFGSDSIAQRDKLIAALRETTFVLCVDSGDGKSYYVKPGEVYLSTQRLKDLFAGVPGVLIVDDTVECLKGEEVRELLEACGATRYLQPVEPTTPISWDKKQEIRRAAGLERSSWERSIVDWTLRGLDELLAVLRKLPAEARRLRAAMLWDALADVESRRGAKTFLGEYSWSYSHESKTATFDAAFVRILNESDWVPDARGKLQRPEFLVFDALGWKANPFLLSKIHFKPPIIETLAKEAGIDPAVLDLLKKLGLTDIDELRTKLGIEEEDESDDADDVDEDEPSDDESDTSDQDADADDDDGASGDGDDDADTSRDGDGKSASGGTRGGATGAGSGSGTGGGQGSRTGGGAGGNGQNQSGKSKGSKTGTGRPFISYVAAHPDDEVPDPDGLSRDERIALEEQAIALILSEEPNLQRTPTNHPGYDLFEQGREEEAVRYVEVKAMKADLDARPVGMSKKQFESAWALRERYWLYVVERADTSEARIIRINDPAGKARTFTFDQGWTNIAEPAPAVPAAETA
jgi:hypothetical protein